MSAAPKLSLAVQYASTGVCPERAQVRRWVRAALAIASPDVPSHRAGARFVVRFVDRAEGRALNRQFRRRDYPTNVLTFPYEDAALFCADIVLCVPVMDAEARAAHRSARGHAAHLVVHGVLHALGFAHDRAHDAAVMENLEVRILARFGLGDPYAAPEPLRKPARPSRHGND